MTPETIMNLSCIFVGFLFGIHLGIRAMGHNWSGNADKYTRVEYKGTLYHVFYADDVPDDFVISCSSKRKP